MAVRMNQQETGGFKLLEEDALDDRPCPAVKKFVSSVLDRKDMKDQEVANSFRNLMEYRDCASSPSACSVATSSSVLDGDRLNSPPSPSSPTTAPGPMDDQRLPNELLDEICEDIGMKEGMELDFVEYLMEQDTNPHLYMTQEAISSGAFNGASRSSISTPTGSASGSSNSGGSASGSHISSTTTNNNNNNNDKTLTALNPPVTTTTPNFLFKQNFGDSEWLHQIPMSGTHSSSSGSTTVQSSENNSPANKRVHLSASADTSPNKGRSLTPPGYHQYNSAACGRPGVGNHNLFKMPQPGPLMAKRSHSYPQGAPTSSPVQSTNSSSSSSSQGSNASSQASNHAGFSRSQEFVANMSSSSCQPSDCSDQEDLTSSTANNNNNNNKNKSTSPKPVLPSVPPCDFGKPGSPSSQMRGPGGPHFGTGLVPGRDGSMFQRVNKPAPAPAVAGKPLQHHPHQHPHHSLIQQHQRWMGPALSQVNHSTPGAFFSKGMYPAGPFQPQDQRAHHQQQHHHHQHQHHPHHHPGMGHGHMGHLPGPPDPHHPSVPTPVDSPLDQGYFSNESAGNCSNGSAPSPAFTSSSMSSFSSISTIMPADHSQKTSLIHHQQQQQQQQTTASSSGRPTGQKSVHFADLPNNGSPPAYTGASTPSDCAFEMENGGQPKLLPSGKIMPRLNHGMKSGVAPYTVPNNQGQLIGPLPAGYDINNRPSCAMSMSADGSSPGEPMQEYTPKTTHMNGGGGGGGSTAFYMDGNQNMLRMESMHDYPSVPPPLISPQPSDYVSLQAEQSHYGMNQFSSIQQQPVPSQQPSHPSSSAESMPPLQTHPPPPPSHHLQSTQQHHQHHHDQSHPFSSCSYSTQGMPSELGPSHQNSMQISHDSSSSGYHVPLAVSTPMSSRPGPNTRLSGTYPGQMCSPVYDSSYEQAARPDIYPPQQPPHAVMPPSQGVMSSQQVSTVHRGWGAPEDLRVQVGGMQPNLSPMKGGLQPAHSQGLPHMQPSPTPACAAPMGPGPHIHDMGLVNSGVHVGPPHPHMGPHPEYGPCMGMACSLCKMNPAGGPPHPHAPHLGPCPSPGCHMCKMNHPCGVPQSGHVGPCAGPGCTACKINQSGRPQMLSSQQKFIQHLIMDEANSAYRSHPLFPLLRDLVIAEMNFDNPRFHYQQLLSLLPHDFHKLLQNFLHRNPPSGHYQSNQAVESVIMDSLRLAHSNLVDKITHRQEIEKMKANSSASLRSMEEFCQKFDHSVTGPMGRPGPNGAMGLTHPMAAGYHEGGYIQHGMGHVYRSMKDGSDVFGETVLGAASPQANKTESKKHPSLPKEAVAMMMEWLRNHKDNPYPNDDEKAMLIKQTGLSINQINYWFTNARRRILPKWAQCKT